MAKGSAPGARFGGGLNGSWPTTSDNGPIAATSRTGTGALRTTMNGAPRISRGKSALFATIATVGISVATLALLPWLSQIGLYLRSVEMVVVMLFGPTPTLVASFAWVLALSFVATGALLLEVASCEREAGET